MSDFEQLKPCPFCGSHPNDGSVGSSAPGMEDCGYLYIECPHCNGASGKPFIGVHGDDKEVLRGIWNTRSAIASMQGEAVAVLLHPTNLGFVTQGVIGWTEIGNVKVGDKLFTYPPSAASKIAEQDARIKELEQQLEEARKDASKTLYLPWNYISESIPPGAETHWFSPKVWLALSDGRVMPGQCLHKMKNAIYDGPVHSWFIFQEDGGPGLQLSEGIDVIAWIPFAKPYHPGIALENIDAAISKIGGGE